MAIYRYTPNSLIDEVTILRTDGGGARALIHAREGADPTLLHRITRACERKDWQWTPVFLDGKAMLEVRGFGRRDESLLELLRGSGSIQGAAKKIATTNDKVSFKDKVKRRTLQASGFSYFIGDANFMMYGWKEAFENGKLTNPQDFVAGIFYAVGSWFVALFGKGDKSDVQLRDIARDTIGGFRKQGLAVPEGSAIKAAAESYNDGLFKRFKDFCEKFPSEMTNASFGIAGTLITWASIIKLKGYNAYEQKHGHPPRVGHDKISIKMDIGLGLMSTFAGLVSVFIREEKPDPKAPPKKGMALLWQKIKEKPLRIAGGALAISTLCHAASTVKDYRKAGKALDQHKINSSYLTNKEEEEANKIRSGLINRGVFVGTNLLAEGLMSVSSKGHGSGVKTDSSMDVSAYAIMADLVARSPVEKQELLLNQLAKSLVHKDRLGGEASKVAEGIREQMEGLKRNPWVNFTPAISAPVTAKIEETSEHSSETDHTWQKKVSPSTAPVLTPAFSPG